MQLQTLHLPKKHPRINQPRIQPPQDQTLTFHPQGKSLKKSPPHHRTQSAKKPHPLPLPALNPFPLFPRVTRRRSTSLRIRELARDMRQSLPSCKAFTRHLVKSRASNPKTTLSQHRDIPVSRPNDSNAPAIQNPLPPSEFTAASVVRILRRFCPFMTFVVRSCAVQGLEEGVRGASACLRQGQRQERQRRGRREADRGSQGHAEPRLQRDPGPAMSAEWRY